MQKTAIVTGGRKGIGRAIADALAERGYRVIVTGRGETADLGDSPLIYMSCDNSNVDSIHAFAEKVWQEYGPIDLLVNNAGTAPKVRLDLLETTEESYDFVIDTNLKGCFFMTQSIARFICVEKAAHPEWTPRIINISSVSAPEAFKDQALPAAKIQQTSTAILAQLLIFFHFFTLCAPLVTPKIR